MHLPEFVGVGLLFSLLLSDLTGFVGGGLVVPGYIAMLVNRPLILVGTFISAFLSLITLKIISNYALIYGRRKLVLSVLLGFIFNWLISRTGGGIIETFGYVIPGLIAFWMDRQGIVKTLSLLVVNVVAIRIFLTIAFGGRVLP